ncbi:PspC domain-containing protein [Bacillus pseudomycoides]|uniref:PspC domain-containing protein n=1 Tax=Bacillus pseudomycoides TaxID=64104 RepID=A0A2A8H0N6_9BACI|nr:MULTISPECIES: PspC domain-containing protein [Bacillus]AIK36170.1 pspC domain protein [Bacillus pseudomycoides]AJI19296.1 pspC domain protein [Bacillus pseudomycoides]EEM03863.1 Stress-responsive transcriptional regulator PspC [Bacillus pseudomycoides]EEM09437.1 Stress-responsive transcriptional regulator PspC [Bacillus pseudomycoides]EEM15194.1 Stress-responsive transcriptional regulator PspC [Bacillus pseudomycoides DSM 12442]
MEKKLRRSETDKVLFGVCGGLGEYFDISVSMIRILWVIAILCFGTGFLVYLVCLLLMPRSY